MTQDRSAAGDRRTSSTDDVLPSGSAAGRRTAGTASGPAGGTAAAAGGGGAGSRARSAGGRSGDRSAARSEPGPSAAGGSASSGGSTAVTGAGEPATEVLATVGRRRGSAAGDAGAAGATARGARGDRSSAASARPAGQRRRARLGLVRVDPWSVFVLSLLVSIFLGVVLVVAVAALYSLLDGLGVLGSLDTFARDLQVIKEGQTLVGFGRVFGIAAVLAAVDVVLLTVLATLAAFLYNLCSSLTGGLEVVLAERE